MEFKIAEKRIENNKNEKEVISLDNADFSNQDKLINSPRSIKACYSLGIRVFELYKLSEKQFKEKYPDVFTLSPELYKYRYDSEEKFRLTLIKLVMEERKKIIEKEERENERMKREKEEKEYMERLKKEREEEERIEREGREEEEKLEKEKRKKSKRKKNKEEEEKDLEDNKEKGKKDENKIKDKNNLKEEEEKKIEKNILNKSNTKIKKIFDKKRANTPNPFKRKINIDKKLISLKISDNNNKSNIDIIKNSKNKKKFKINKTDQNLN
jgi:hypothetical protein